MANVVRSIIERFLPWWDAAREKGRDAQTERIRQRSINTRIRAERVIAEYRRASLAHAKAGRAMIEETRRPR